jgi:hypothetical protein
LSVGLLCCSSSMRPRQAKSARSRRKGSLPKILLRLDWQSILPRLLPGGHAAVCGKGKCNCQ